jgi:hypothetical protein
MREGFGSVSRDTHCSRVDDGIASDMFPCWTERCVLQRCAANDLVVMSPVVLNVVVNVVLKYHTYTAPTHPPSPPHACHNLPFQSPFRESPMILNHLDPPLPLPCTLIPPREPTTPDTSNTQTPPPAPEHENALPSAPPSQQT